MNKNYMYPLKLIPVLKDIVWGGSRLYSEYGKRKVNAEDKKIAESWELAVHENGVNIIENGDFSGYSLKELFELSNGEIVSRSYSGKFPILIKFIDAEQDLSVQVHPDDNYTGKSENESGKTEMWYIIDAEPNSKIVYGLKDDFTRKELAALLADNQSGKFMECLNYISVKPGDVYFIPAGLIHAIGKGILIAEIQQNSDTTYRVYDYDRLADGKKRELHTEKALDVCIKNRASLDNRTTARKVTENMELLVECEYFTVEKYTVCSDIELEASEISFNSIICLDGSADIVFNGDKYKMRKGDSYFLSAGLGRYKISGNCLFLRSMLK